MAKLFILLLMISFCLYGQNVRISDTPGTPHNTNVGGNIVAYVVKLDAAFTLQWSNDGFYNRR